MIKEADRLSSKFTSRTTETRSVMTVLERLVVGSLTVQVSK